MNEMNLLRTFFTISIQNIKVTLGIYIQALKLFLKGAKYINRPKISKTKFTIINERDREYKRKVDLFYPF